MMNGFFSGGLPLNAMAHVLFLISLGWGGYLLVRQLRKQRLGNRARISEIVTLRSDVQAISSRLAIVDPSQFRDRLARLEREQKLSDADRLVEAYFAEQADAIADAARVMAEREVFLSHNRGADGLPDAVRFAELGLAARPKDPHLAPLLDELRAKTQQEAEARPSEEPGEDDATPHLQELDDIDLLNIARKFFERGQFGLAGITARRAAALAHEQVGPRTTRYAAALNMQSETLQALGRLEEAVAPMQQAIEIAAETLGQTNPNYITGLCNFTELLHRAGRLADAETCQRHVLALLERTMGTHHPDYAAEFRNLTSIQNERAQSGTGGSPLARAAAAAMAQGSTPANESVEPSDQLFCSRRSLGLGA